MCGDGTRRLSGGFVRAVFDTSVLAAACPSEGLCAALLRLARKGESQPAFRNKFAVTTNEVRDALALIREASESVLLNLATIHRPLRDRSADAILDWCPSGPGGVPGDRR
jgi:hypothetical protein